MFHQIILPAAILLTTAFIVSTSPLYAKEGPAPTGPYSVITNNVYDRGDQTGLKAGTVSVRVYETGAIVFDSLTEENGWIGSVQKSGGTSSGDRVIVDFDHPELGGFVRFMIEPGKLDIR